MLYEVITVVGKLAAGDAANLRIADGQAVRVTTGAPLPQGADAVLSEEFCEPSTDAIIAHHIAEEGRITSYNVCYTKLLRQTRITSLNGSTAWMEADL